MAAPTAVSWLQLPALNLGPAVNAAGESHYQDALEAIAGDRTSFGVHTPLITVELVREPANVHDPNAVRVEADGRQPGCVAKEDAPRFHAVIDKLAGQDRRATCRARLTGGWDRAPLDRGSIGLQLLTGRRPTLWNGRAAFLPATPYHENYEVQLHYGLPDEGWPRDKAIVILADAGADALALRHGESWLGHIIGRPDLVAFIGRVVAAGLPPTARVRVQQGRLLVQLADQDAISGQLSRLGTGDLPGIRRQLTPTGRWVCQRCGRLWQDPRHPGHRWYVCPNCFSYSLTHPM